MVRVNDTVQLNAKVYDGAGYMVPEERVEILGWEKTDENNYNYEIDYVTGLFTAKNVTGNYSIRIYIKIFDSNILIRNSNIKILKLPD
jgi:hypothetical protein